MAFFSNVTIVAALPQSARTSTNFSRHPRGQNAPGRVFDRVIGLDEVPEGYRTMNERRRLMSW
jgi:hypothetical protein